MNAVDCPADWWTIISHGMILSCTDPVILVGIAVTFLVCVFVGVLIAWLVG